MTKADANDILREFGPEELRRRSDKAGKHWQERAAGDDRKANGSGESEKTRKANGQAGADAQDEDSARRIRLVPFDKIKLSKSRRYLIRGVIPRVGLTVVWGPPKSGKSFWTFDAMMHVALGWEYRGRRVHQGPVVYCAFEGQSGIEARVEAFRQKFLVGKSDPVPFYLEPITLDLVRDQAELIAVVRRQLADRLPVVAVLDTLNRSLRGSESSDEDMSAYVQAADTVREAFSCAVVIVHHCGIDGTRPRGHTSLSGAIEAQLSVKRDAADNIVVEVELAKDGPQGETIASRLEVVEVGTDEDGETITSCVVQPVEGQSKVMAPTRKLSNRQKLALKALNRLIADHGEPAPAAFQLPAGVIAVPVTEWRDELSRCGAIERDAKNPREDFRRVKDALQARAHIAIRDDLVWTL